MSEPQRDTARSTDAAAGAAPRRRGRLKIFLGAAPGVGKTFEMLSDGAERVRAGGDVVAALAETHGRPETQALLDLIEVIPRRDVDHRGHRVGELDLDAVLARRPALALVDDLAHANAASCRHPQRWQDVVELLDAGIDVYATLDIRHVESLADIVAGITRVAVDETVPDSVIETAEIEVVDLPADELIRRLEEGKVQVPPETRRVLGHYFSRPVLSALREMVLRRVALSIDRQMLGDPDALAVPGSFAGGERVLVAVNDLPGVDGLVRAGKRLADALHAPWTVIYIRTPRAAGFGEAQNRRVADALRLAATLGATIATVPAERVSEGLIAQIEATRATQLVIGKSRRSWWFELRHGSVVDAMMRASDGLAVHVLPGQTSVPRIVGQAPAEPAGTRWGGPGDYGAIVALIGITTLIGRLLEPLIGLNAIDLLYLLPVIAAAGRFGLRPGLVTGLAAALAYNVFFLAPRDTLTVDDPQSLVSLLVLLGIAAFTSRLTGRLKTRATLGLRSAHENAAVAAFAQVLARVSDRRSTAGVICEEVSRLLDVDVMLLVERAGAMVVVTTCPDGLTLGPVDAAAAEWAWSRGEQAGAGTATLNAADWLFVPLKTSLGTLAVLGMARENGRDPVPADRAVLMSALVGQAALAHERLHLEDDMRDVSVLKTRDRLRMALISALGRDLAAPLGIMARAIGEAAIDNPHSPTLAGARREADRLQRFLGDLVDMVRVESGELTLSPEPVDLTDMVGEAAHDIHDLLRDIAIDLRIPANLPWVRADRRLLHHILVNLLGNAVQGSVETGTIVVEGRRVPDAVLLTVRDQGPGIEPGGEEAVFDDSAGGPDDDGDAGGLGLAMVKGFADALGLGVAAANHPAGGSALTLRFPEALVMPGGAKHRAAAGPD